MYKQELARAAGVTLQVLRKWLKDDNIELPKKYKMLPPHIVKFLCEKYVIILEE
ncbi:MAG: hypothetical protein Q4A56_07635 [Porphyromonadaceae bacterium]|nr:hypothetical protein [Porphyromonadaceae bacterium]